MQRLPKMFHNTISLVLLLGTAMLVGYLYYANESNPSIAKQIHIPDSYFKNVTIVRYQEQGDKQSKLSTPLMQVYSKDEITSLSHPRVEFYRNKNTAWKVQSRFGKLLEKPQVTHLWDHVRVYQAKTSSHPATEILTESLYYHPEKNRVSTDIPVTIKQSHTIIHAIGLDGDLDNSKIKLLKKVVVHYEP